MTPFRHRAPLSPRRAVVSFLVLLLAFAVVPTAQAQPVPAVGTPTAAATPDASHPYSNPVWLPLREPAVISCVRTNCDTSAGADYHGYWAIDFIGRRGAPIYAAGAGILHVGATERTCKTATTQSAGTWVWIDHGGGRTTKYTHLDSIAVADGSLVTPATMIGRMGHWGDISPCTTNYLHFEVRERGVTGPRVEPKRLLACTSSGRVSLPQAFGGATSFDQLAKGAHRTPEATSACIGSPASATPDRLPVTVRRGDRSLRLVWGTLPSDVSKIKVRWQVWSPSLKRWGGSRYVDLPATGTSGTLRELSNGRYYRLWVAAENSRGWSKWSTQERGIPAGRPAVPRTPRFLTWPHGKYIHYGWWKSEDNGKPVTRYDTQVRCYRNGRYGAWTTQRVPGTVYYYNHQGVSRYRTCQVRVRAVNVVGASSWSTALRIRR